MRRFLLALLILTASVALVINQRGKTELPPAKEHSFGYHVTIFRDPNAVYITGFRHIGAFGDGASEAPEPSEDDPGEKD